MTAPLDPNPPTEPLWTVATVTALGTTAVTGLIVWGVHVTDDQRGWLLGAVAVAAPLIVAAVGRRRVYSPATVQRMLRRR